MTSHRIAPDERVVRRPPSNLKPEHELLFSHEYERSLTQVEILHEGETSLFSNGMLLKSGRVSLSEYFGFDVPLLRSRIRAQAAGLRLRAVSRVARVEHDIVYFTDSSSVGFFHWFGDSLQKLEAVLEWRSDLADRRFFIPYGLPAFVLDSLGAYPLRLVRPGRFERIVVPSLAVIPRVATTGNFRPRLMRSMRSRLRSHFGSSGVGSRRIYISRDDAPRRRVVNEAEIRPVLEAHGVEVVSLSGMPFAEQVALTGSAELIIGFHGAGLTHSLFMPTGGRVLELRADGDAHNNCYFSLASALDLEYQYLLCAPTRADGTVHSGDFTVDIDLLATALDGLSDRG